jgi:hypothetical protein
LIETLCYINDYNLIVSTLLLLQNNITTYIVIRYSKFNILSIVLHADMIANAIIVTTKIECTNENS